ncbi:MAG: DNA recombination protein RmuC, partial [Candidatus Marinamargulisbacteria bacterium]
WGEVQLGNLLEQIFSPDQYGKNVQIKKGSQERVEYAVRLPGKTDGGDPVWLPIDAKFPQDIFHELIESQESGDRLLVDASERKLESRIKLEANAMSEKYIDPPTTTDFGVIFLPTEGLYAEVLKIRGLHQLLQDKYRILIAGPTTLAALLNSLQMGFRTLAIEKRSSEVWTVLKTVKTEFGKFGDLLEKTHKKLQEAGNTIENAARKSRTIEKKLGRVEDLPQEEEPVMMTGAEATSPLFKASGEA